VIGLAACAQQPAPAPAPQAAPTGFKGTVKLDVRDSVADWNPYTPKKAPEGSPNFLFILYDDTGLAAWSPYGGRINMPTLDKLASNGLIYTQWHTTALCSPTRSTILTGRNHHVNDTVAVGYDSGDAVSQEYKSPGAFKGGTIDLVDVTVEKAQYLDLEREARRVLMVQ
jgi:arylsulfatase